MPTTLPHLAAANPLPMRSPEPTLTLRPLEPADWPEVRRINEAGIATGNVTFEVVAPAGPVDAGAAHRPPRYRTVAGVGYFRSTVMTLDVGS